MKKGRFKNRFFVNFFIVSLILLSLNIISNLLIHEVKAYKEYHYIDEVYNVTQSTDDCHYAIGEAFSLDNEVIHLKSNHWDMLVGIRFDNISKPYENCTLNRAILSLYGENYFYYDDPQWITIYGIDEKDTDTFVNVTDFILRPYTNKHLNWNIHDMFDVGGGWENSSDIVEIVNEILENGFDVNNSIAFKITSAESEVIWCEAYDNAPNIAPKLYLKWVYYVDIVVEEEYEFYETYDCLDIWEGSEAEPAENKSLDHVHICEYDDKGQNMYELSNYMTEHIVYSHNRWWTVVYEETSFDPWLYNSTDRINWYGSEISTISIDGGLITLLFSTLDSNGDLHIYWKEDGTWDLMYMKVELENDGSITTHTEQIVISTLNYYPLDIMVDDQDYPVVLFRKNSSPYRVYMKGSSTKDGTWTDDYYLMVVEMLFGHTSRAILVPMKGNGGKDFLIVYSKAVRESSNNWRTACKYFDELTETLGNEYIIDVNRFTSEGDNSTARARYWNQANGLTRAYQNNETFITIWGWDEDVDKKNMACYRTINGGVTWDEKVLYELDPSAVTDQCGHIPRMDTDNNLIVFFRHNDINEGNHTFFYSILNNENIEDEFMNNWDAENIELLNSANLYTGNVAYEDIFSWSITPKTDNNKIEIVFGYNSHNGMDEPCLHIISEDFTITGGGVGGIHYKLYEDNQTLVAECFTDIESARLWAKKYCVEERIDLGNTINWMLGLLGLIMMPLSFVLFVMNARSDIGQAFIYLMCLFLVGMGLFIGWLWG